MLRNERTLRSNPLEMLAKAYSLRARLSLQTRAVMPTKPNPSNARLEGSGTATRKPRISPPLFRFRRWLANLRVFEIAEIKSVPHVPVSRPFVERLIGTIRREYLDQTLLWNRFDLARKLGEFRDYYNEHRVHRSLGGTTPAERAGEAPIARAQLVRYGWRDHCRGLFQIPVAA